MGHIRLGTLPRTRKWIQVLDLIGGSARRLEVVAIYCYPLRYWASRLSKLWLINQEVISMKLRKWDAKTKAIIVLEGLKGKPVATLCQDHQISQGQYYQWRDQS